MDDELKQRLSEPLLGMPLTACPMSSSELDFLTRARNLGSTDDWIRLWLNTVRGGHGSLRGGLDLITLDAELLATPLGRLAQERQRQRAIRLAREREPVTIPLTACPMSSSELNFVTRARNTGKPDTWIRDWLNHTRKAHGPLPEQVKATTPAAGTSPPPIPIPGRRLRLLLLPRRRGPPLFTT